MKATRRWREAILAAVGVGSGLALGAAASGLLSSLLPPGLEGGLHGWGAEVALIGGCAAAVPVTGSVRPVLRSLGATRSAGRSPMELLRSGMPSTDLLAGGLVAVSLPLLVASGLAVKSYVTDARGDVAVEAPDSVLLRVRTADGTVLVDGAFRRLGLYGTRAVGKGVRTHGETRRGPWREIRGVLPDAAARGLGVRGDAMTLFLPILDHPARELDLMVEGPAPARELGEEARRAVRAVLPGARVEVRGTLEEQLSRLTAPLDWLAGLLAVAGLLAAAVAFAGTFGATADEMRRRRGEIGLRRAVGARRRDALALAFRWSLRVAGAGAAAGLILALPVARALEFLVPGVVLAEPMVWVGGPCLLLAAAALGALRPARRAARVPPASIA